MYRHASIALLVALAIYVAGYTIAGTRGEWSGSGTPTVCLAEPWLSIYRPLTWLE